MSLTVIYNSRTHTVTTSADGTNNLGASIGSGTVTLDLFVTSSSERFSSGTLYLYIGDTYSHCTLMCSVYLSSLSWNNYSCTCTINVPSVSKKQIATVYNPNNLYTFYDVDDQSGYIGGHCQRDEGASPLHEEVSPTISVSSITPSSGSIITGANNTTLTYAYTVATGHNYKGTAFDGLHVKIYQLGDDGYYKGKGLPAYIRDADVSCSDTISYSIPTSSGSPTTYGRGSTITFGLWLDWTGGGNGKSAGFISLTVNSLPVLTFSQSEYLFEPGDTITVSYTATDAQSGQTLTLYEGSAVKKTGRGSQTFTVPTSSSDGTFNRTYHLNDGLENSSNITVNFKKDSGYVSIYNNNNQFTQGKVYVKTESNGWTAAEDVYVRDNNTWKVSKKV